MRGAIPPLPQGQGRIYLYLVWLLLFVTDDLHIVTQELHALLMTELYLALKSE
jgi:hypothetical protein